MNLKTWYDSGSATVLSGSTTVSGSGALWGTGGTDDNIMVGDLFSVPSQPMVPAIPIASVSADGELELLWAWPGADVTAQPYIIRYVGIIERSTRANRMALERMGEISAWYDVIVETDADRLALETAGSPLRANYRVLVQNDGVIWGKATSAYGDWIGPVEFRGPAITLNVTEVDDVPYGAPPEVNMTPRAGGYDLAFDIPRGMIIEPGTTTTLAPDQPAAVTFVPVTGGYRLDIAIPRGPTGDIDGVTPFWVSRLGSDADAAAARAGLGAMNLPDATAGGSPVNSDFDNFTEAGWVPQLVQGAKAPEASLWFYLLVARYGADVFQMALPYANTQSACYFRTRVTGIWSLWKPVSPATSDAAQITTGVFNADRIPSTLAPDKAFRRGNILGVVSQASGVPTGAIVERGANANGEYVRFADGTQICTNLVSNLNANSGTFSNIFGATSGSMLYRNAIVPLAASFVNAAYAVTANVTTRGIIRLSGANTQHDVLVQLAFENDTQPIPFTILAVGRWF